MNPSSISFRKSLPQCRPNPSSFFMFLVLLTKHRCKNVDLEKAINNSTGGVIYVQHKLYWIIPFRFFSYTAELNNRLACNLLLCGRLCHQTNPQSFARMGSFHGSTNSGLVSRSYTGTVAVHPEDLADILRYNLLQFIVLLLSNKQRLAGSCVWQIALLSCSA